MKRQYTDRAMRFAGSLRWDDVPSTVQHQTKRCLLDALGALIAGARTPPAEIVAKIARQQFGGSEATILVHGVKAAAGGAANSRAADTQGLFEPRRQRRLRHDHERGDRARGWVAAESGRPTRSAAPTAISARRAIM